MDRLWSSHGLRQVLLSCFLSASCEATEVRHVTSAQGIKYFLSLKVLMCHLKLRLAFLTFLSHRCSLESNSCGLPKETLPCICPF